MSNLNVSTINGATIGSGASSASVTTDTAANFIANNPVLASGMMGYETDTGLLKVGDATSTWNELAYFGTSNVVGDAPAYSYYKQCHSSICDPTTTSWQPTTDRAYFQLVHNDCRRELNTVYAYVHAIDTGVSALKLGCYMLDPNTMLPGVKLWEEDIIGLCDATATPAVENEVTLSQTRFFPQGYCYVAVLAVGPTVLDVEGYNSYSASNAFFWNIGSYYLRNSDVIYKTGVTTLLADLRGETTYSFNNAIAFPCILWSNE